MFDLLSLSICAIVVGVAIIQAGFVVAYLRVLLSKPVRIEDAACPPAAIVLSVRGPDPFLETNMAAVLDQDYPDFKLFIIVDSPTDPVWEYVNRIKEAAPDRVETLQLQNHLKTCSLKCCALAEAVEELDRRYEVVAFLDGDAPPHRTWLRDLVAPLADERVGVSTGNRWYTPQNVNWGTVVRYFWNAGGVVQVWLNDIIWAGSMALRRDVIDSIGLVEAWRSALSVDGTVVRQLKPKGLKPRFAPSVIMANREDIALSSFIPWAERQMIAAKSSGSGWSIILFHACTIASCMFVPPALLFAGLLLSNPVAIGSALTAIIVYWLGAGLSSLAIELAMQRTFNRNRVPSPWLNLQAMLYFVPGMLAAHIVYLRLLIGACRRNRVSWRGIEYEIHGATNVRMLEYRPFVSSKPGKVVESVV